VKIVITGATGMVGEGVLHVALSNPEVEGVLIVNRSSTGVTHPKLTEIIHADFFNLDPIATQLKGYDACLFCLGVSSVGMKEATYFKLTYTLTMHFAQTFLRENPNASFSYISGVATDSTEKGRSMWARVKGKTENDLLRMPFKAVYCFRPGYLHPIKGMKYTHPYYAYIGWMYPFFTLVLSRYTTTLEELGRAMLRATTQGYDKNILEVNDILLLSKKG
jgi:uncharacterized protein YbjT (DUF2867 family)